MKNLNDYDQDPRNALMRSAVPNPAYYNLYYPFTPCDVKNSKISLLYFQKYAITIGLVIMGDGALSRIRRKDSYKSIVNQYDFPDFIGKKNSESGNSRNQQ